MQGGNAALILRTSGSAGVGQPGQPGGGAALGRNPNHGHESHEPIKKYGTVNEYKSMNKRLLQSDIS